MSIYENGPAPKPPKKRTTIPPQKANTKEILNNQDLTLIVQQIKNGPKTAKELLYDTEKNIIGVIQRNDDPYFFDNKQVKELEKLIKGEK